MSERLLTVMLPVYNGAGYLQNLLSQWASQIESAPELYVGKIEIRVIDNASTDGTAAVVESFQRRLNRRFADLYLHRESVHLPTAEENVFRGFSYNLGKFTWVLGVDDFPVFANFARVTQLLAADDLDFVMFNLAIVDQELKLSSLSVTNLPCERIERDIVRFAEDLGLWFVLAGFSNQIVRTDKVRDYNLKSLSEKTSPIYAHVIAYLEIFKGRRSALMSFPLVTYRVTFSDESHWQKAATKLQVFDQYFWSLGPIRQLHYLEKKGVIAQDFFLHLRDRNEYNVFRTAQVIINKIISQLEIMIGDRSERNRIKAAELDEMVDYLSSHDPSCRQIMWRMQAEYTAICDPRVNARRKRRIIGDLRLLLHNHVQNGTCAAFFVEPYKGFYVYKIRERYFAGWSGRLELFERRLRDIYTETDEAPFFAQGECRDEVCRKLDNWITTHAQVLAAYPIPEVLAPVPRAIAGTRFKRLRQRVNRNLAARYERAADAVLWVRWILFYKKEDGTA